MKYSFRNGLAIFSLALSVFFLNSCTQESELKEAPIADGNIEVLDDKNDPNFNQTFTENFSPSVTVGSEDGILSFESFTDLDRFLSEINVIAQVEADAWEESMNYTSIRKIFYDVMNAEDALDAQLFALSEDKQQEVLAAGEYHSAELDAALANGQIRYYTSADGSEYWDYTIIDPGVAAAVNENGLIRVEGQLIKYSNAEFIYVVKDGDINKLSRAESHTENYEDEFIRVVKMEAFTPEPNVESGERSPAPLCWSGPHTNYYSTYNGWTYPTSKKRLKAWIDGSAYANFGNSECVHGTKCTYQLRTQAQKKNFWGNWKYSSSWGPTVHIDDANWTYKYSLMPSCTDYPVEYVNAISGGSYPKPIWDYFIPWTNNGYFGMHPHTSGWWVFSGYRKYICNTIKVTYNVPVYYYIYGPSHWDLEN